MVVFNKKSEAGLVAVLIIIIVFLFFGWLINMGQRECKSNRDCGSEAYCGSDFSCHQYPSIQKTVIQYNLFWPAIILGAAIVLAAWIYKNPRPVSEPAPAKSETKQEEIEDVSEPYYKSDNDIRMP